MGSPAYPTNLQARARVDEALDRFSTNFHEYFCLFTIYPSFGIPHGVGPELAAAMTAFGNEHAPRWLTVLDRHMLGDRPFVCGPEISPADYLGAAFVTLGEAADFDFGPYPNVRRWIARMKTLTSWDATYAGFNAFVCALQAGQSQAAQ